MLTDKQKEAVGDRTVYELSFTIGSESIHALGGKATVNVPYTLKSSEDGSKVTVWYLNDSGELTKVDGTVYDIESQTVTFTVDHFSKYVVGTDSGSGNGAGLDTAMIIGIVAVVILAIAAMVFIITKKEEGQG